MSEVYSIGTLRAALEGVPDDARLYAQVVAEDGTAWTMHCALSLVPGSKPQAYVLTMRHPTLRTLKGADQTGASRSES